MLYPLKLIPPLKDYLWGGTKLKEKFHKETELPTVAESWELACRKDGHSIIGNGPSAGMELSRYIAMEGDRVTGTHAARVTYFPLLVKLIDTAKDLSIQVHPDNEHALWDQDERGKTELWYVVEAEPGATLIHGVNRNVTKVELRQRIEDGTILEICNRVPAHPGDVYLIEAGTLHSVGAGVTLAEIQQNANTTYRLYDYGRPGRDGVPRELQIDRALGVLRMTPTPPLVLPPPQSFFAEYTVQRLASCEYFTVYHVALDGRIHLFSGRDSFHSILLLEGILELEYPSGKEILERGASIFVPAGCGPYWLRGHGRFLLTMV
ncbi:MAG: class I mannose-6-phosphate isomerase [Schwartzia sp.]|nr:class I mannose-6-phosphate isomerase [Schwartzia sp. (in: firmicutes)]